MGFLIKKISNFFLSLSTTLWSLAIALVLMLAGAVIMPGSGEFQEIHSLPMFHWLLKQRLEITWWLWGLIGILSVVSLNTVFCSIESLIKKRNVTQWLLLVSPQIIHIGFLFMLLAHLLSALGGAQGFTVATEGSIIRFADTEKILKIINIEINSDSSGYTADWAVEVEYLLDGKTYKKDMIRPNSPSLFDGLNINVKDLRDYPDKAVLLQVNREPGAFWALIGGILFTVGIVTLIMLRIRGEK